jgi:hypothetical protein
MATEFGNLIFLVYRFKKLNPPKKNGLKEGGHFYDFGDMNL